MRIIGLLWCNGDSKEKACELYESVQDYDLPKIAFDDKDIRPNLNLLFDYSIKMVFENEPRYMRTEHSI